MAYVALALYVVMVHHVETTGLRALCAVLVEETKLKRRARTAVEYIVPPVARVLASMALVVLMGKFVREA